MIDFGQPKSILLPWPQMPHSVKQTENDYEKVRGWGVMEGERRLNIKWSKRGYFECFKKQFYGLIAN